MTPEQIQQWYAQHQGQAGEPEGPDSNGITTYRAADGAFINVRKDGTLAMQGVSPGRATAEQQPPDQPPAPGPQPTSGAMSQSQLETLLAQVAPNNDPGRLEF